MKRMKDNKIYFGLTEFNDKVKKVRIDSSIPDNEFYEELALVRFHLMNDQNLFSKNGFIYDVKYFNNSINLKSKVNLTRVREHLNFNINILEIISKKTKSIKSNDIEFIYNDFEADCDLLLQDRIHFDDINSWSSNNVWETPQTFSYQKHSFVSMNIPQLDDLTGVLNLLTQFLDNHVIGLENSLAIFIANNEIIIFPKVSDSKSYIRALHSLFDMFMKYIKTYVFDQFYNCICEDGCFNCLFDTRFQSRTKKSEYPSKNSVFRILASLNRYEGIEDIIKVRATNNIIDNASLNEILVCWRETILNIFKERFEFVINDQYSISRANLDSNILGLCNYNNKIISISNTLAPLHLIVEVIAHEYTHNWQNEHMSKTLKESNIPFDGKLFIEGFAQWVAFRVMDYFGIHSNLTEITLRGVDVLNPDEYGLGFRICRFIEEKYGGFSGLVDFFIKGYLIDTNGNKIDHLKIVDKSPIKPYLS